MMEFELLVKRNLLIFKISIFTLILNLSPGLSQGTDWPMWRYDTGRTAASPEELPDELHLLWTLHYTPREPVWDDPLNQDLMQFDRLFEPIVMGKYMYIGFNDRDKVIAIDTDNGEQKWAFYVNGPIRLPMVGWNDKLYFVSDDGYLYCLSAGSGKLLWKFRAGPSDRKLLGNKRLISMWPARGGPVLKDGVLYFAASIWPFMGTFIYALNVETGEIVWRNEETSGHFIQQPHNYPAFAGVAPQGVFVVSGDRLLVPGGRSVPACFDRNTGELLYYHLAANGKTGGAFVCANDRIFFNHHRDRVTHLYNLEDGKPIKRGLGKYPVLDRDFFYFSGESITACKADNPGKTLWEVEIDASGDLIKAGSRLYATGANLITAVQIGENEKPKILWNKNVAGKVERLVAANGKLFAVTLDGRIMAFGNKNERIYDYPYKPKEWHASAEITAQTRAILDQTGINEGYAFFYGVKQGDLLANLVLNSDLNIIAIDPDVDKINRLRHRFDDMGIYGQRLSLIPGTPETLQLPAYLASLTIFCDSNIMKVPPDTSWLNKLYYSMRPYGSKTWLSLSDSAQNEFSELVQKSDLAGLEIQRNKNSVVLTRQGALPGSDNWTHQYGNIANTVKSDDELVKMPLGILWFGGNSNLDVLPRHGHGPPEQVVDGRLIIEGMKVISARDVYSGRVLWQYPLDSLGTFQMYYNETYKDAPLVATYNQRHIPGANGRGTNFVATSDFVYIVQGNDCYVLDIASGQRIKIFSLPLLKSGNKPMWAYIGVYENYLVAGSEFAKYSDRVPTDSKEQAEMVKLSLKKRTDKRDKENYDLSASQTLVVMDRYSGEVKWQTNARHGFIHNSIIAASGKIFCLDKLPAFIEDKLKRRGLSPPDDYRLLAFDVQNGNILWQKQSDVFGSWLGYSEEHDVLLQASRPSGDMLRGEKGERMIVYTAKDGTKMWDKEIKYHNPPILHGDMIITEHLAINLLFGEQIYRRDPLTDEIIPWTYTKTKGCNYSIASEHLLSFRSSAAAFFDLTDDGGTGHFGGFRSGCTSNLIAANGVLNAPEYTRTCQCSFQNQTSLALVHTPGIEYWTTNDYKWNKKPIKLVGLNLNAPGDRVADNGTLWLDYPSVGGPSPDIPVKIEPNKPRYLRRYSMFIQGNDGPSWIAASAIIGLSSIEITLSNEIMSDAYYTVRLHFAELEDKKVGERVFDVSIQDQQFLRQLDIINEVSKLNCSVVKIFHGIKVEDKLFIYLTPSTLHPECEPLLCGIEIELEE